MGVRVLRLVGRARPVDPDGLRDRDCHNINVGLSNPDNIALLDVLDWSSVRDGEQCSHGADAGGVHVALGKSVVFHQGTSDKACRSCSSVIRKEWTNRQAILGCDWRLV